MLCRAVQCLVSCQNCQALRVFPLNTVSTVVYESWTSLVAQWIRTRLPVQGTGVPAKVPGACALGQWEAHAPQPRAAPVSLQLEKSPSKATKTERSHNLKMNGIFKVSVSHISPLSRASKGMLFLSVVSAEFALLPHLMCVLTFDYILDIVSENHYRSNS